MESLELYSSIFLWPQVAVCFATVFYIHAWFLSLMALPITIMSSIGDCSLCPILAGFQIMSPLRKEPLSSRSRLESMPANEQESLWEAKSLCLALVQ